MKILKKFSQPRLQSPEQIRCRIQTVKSSELTIKQLIQSVTSSKDIDQLVSTILSLAGFPPLTVHYDPSIIQQQTLTDQEQKVQQSLHGQNRSDYIKSMQLLREYGVQQQELIHISARLAASPSFIQKLCANLERIQGLNQQLSSIKMSIEVLLQECVNDALIAYNRVLIMLKFHDLVQILTQRNVLLQVPSFTELHILNDILKDFPFPEGPQSRHKKFAFIHQLFDVTNTTPLLERDEIPKSVARYTYIKPPPPSDIELLYSQISKDLYRQLYPLEQLITKREIDESNIRHQRFEMEQLAKFSIIKNFHEYLIKVGEYENFFQELKFSLGQTNHTLTMVHPYFNSKCMCVFENSVNYLAFEETTFKTEKFQKLQPKTNINFYREAVSVEPIKGLPPPGSNIDFGRRLIHPMSFRKSDNHHDNSKSKLQNTNYSESGPEHVPGKVLEDIPQQDQPVDTQNQQNIFQADEDKLQNAVLELNQHEEIDIRLDSPDVVQADIQ